MADRKLQDQPTETLKRTVSVTSSRNPLLSEELIKALNFRIEFEEYSSRIYLAMSLWFNNKGYTGAASLWKKYSDEEIKHADWSKEYLLAMGVQPITPRLEAPKQNYESFAEIISISYDHEIKITIQCKELATQALKAGDHMLYTLALQYVKEQIEEHDKMQTWLDKLETFGTDRIALRMLDEEMGR